MRIRMLPCLLLACVAAGCGEGKAPGSAAGTPAAAAGPVDACALFTAADAEQVLGGPVGSPSRGADMQDEESGRALSNCMYQEMETMASASILVRRSPGEPMPASLDEARAQARRQVEGMSEGEMRELAEIGARLLDESEAVPGLGRLAYWSPETKQLTVLVAPHWMLVASASRPGADPGAERAAAEQVARMVTGRL
jgi:hypothetical protein